MSSTSLINKVQEYINCKNDFFYFCKNYILLEVPGGDIPFNPYSRHFDLIRFLEKNKHLITNKSRQIGVSTIIQAYSAWLALFFDNVVVGIISKDASEATSFARNIRTMIEKVPFWLKPKGGQKSQPGFQKYTEQSFILTNGSKIYSSTVNPKSPGKTLRGKPITFLIIDEAAFIDNIDKAWEGMVSALATSQKHARRANVPYGTIIISTPNKTLGQGKWFYSKYTRALGNETDDSKEISLLKPIDIYWRDIPELANDPSWYETQCALLDYEPNIIQQELELKFLPGGGSFFSEETCLKIQNSFVEPIEKIKIHQGEAWTFKNPDPDKYYLIGIDTASEYQGDLSAICIFEYETMELVWEYSGKLDVTSFQNVVMFAAARYTGLLIPEDNSMGNQISEGIKYSIFNSSLYRMPTEKGFRYGINTNMKTRPLMIDALYNYVSKYPELIKSKRLGLELVGLVEKASGRVEAEKGSRDDLALTASFCFYVMKYDPPKMFEKNGKYSENMQDIVNMNENIKRDSLKKEGNTEDLHAMYKEKINDILNDPANFGQGQYINVLDIMKSERY